MPLQTSEITEEDIEKMGNTELKTFIIKHINNNEEQVKQAFKKFKEYVTEELNHLKAHMSEIKNTLEQIKSRVGSLQNRMKGAEERISKLADVSCA